MRTQLLGQQRIGVIGAGTMGTVILQGLLAIGVSRGRLCAAESRAGQRRKIARQLRIRVTSDVQAVARTSSVIILAVKPQEVAKVCARLSALRRLPLVISIVGGCNDDGAIRGAC